MEWLIGISALLFCFSVYVSWELCLHIRLYNEEVRERVKWQQLCCDGTRLIDKYVKELFTREDTIRELNILLAENKFASKAKEQQQ